MPRALRVRLLPVVALGAALAGACRENTSAGALTLTVTPASRSFGVDQDSIAVTPDSVVVLLSGSGAPAARWAASHDTASSWLTLVSAAGTGSGVLRWVLNPIYLAPGVYVDTLAITAPGATGSPAVVIDTLTVRPAAAQRRAARPPQDRAAELLVNGRR